MVREYALAEKDLMTLIDPSSQEILIGKTQ
jgi:hypothetical protein